MPAASSTNVTDITSGRIAVRYGVLRATRRTQPILRVDSRVALPHVNIRYQLACSVGIILRLTGCRDAKGAGQICFGQQEHLILRRNPRLRIVLAAGGNVRFHHVILESGQGAC